VSGLDRIGIVGEVIARCPQSRRSMENAVRRSLSDWGPG
jgi:hypothetical protein